MEEKNKCDTCSKYPNCGVRERNKDIKSVVACAEYIVKPSILFEGDNSSLKQAYDNAVRPMTNETILKRAQDKARENGWKAMKTLNLPGCPLDYEFIFSHDFAKAFFGEEIICPSCKRKSCKQEFLHFIVCCKNYKKPRVLAWQFHLQTMVLKENPIQYLAKFL